MPGYSAANSPACSYSSCSSRLYRSRNSRCIGELNSIDHDLPRIDGEIGHELDRHIQGLAAKISTDHKPDLQLVRCHRVVARDLDRVRSDAGLKIAKHR